MFRRAVAITLAVSFVAMATSGIMMFVINQTSFTLQMHPVHKLFGLLLVASAGAHVWLNSKAISNHIKHRSGAVLGGCLVVAMTLLYGAALNHELPVAEAAQLNELAKQAEQSRHLR